MPPLFRKVGEVDRSDVGVAVRQDNSTQLPHGAAHIFWLVKSMSVALHLAYLHTKVNDTMRSCTPEVSRCFYVGSLRR
jgi:hypothetical protein